MADAVQHRPVLPKRRHDFSSRPLSLRHDNFHRPHHARAGHHPARRATPGHPARCLHVTQLQLLAVLPGSASSSPSSAAFLGSSVGSSAAFFGAGFASVAPAPPPSTGSPPSCSGYGRSASTRLTRLGSPLNSSTRWNSLL